MEAGNTHEVGINQMDQQKPGPLDIKGPLGGGKIFPVNLPGKGVEGPHGFKKMLYVFVGPAAVYPEQKTKGPDPEGRKIQVHADPGGEKGNFAVQRVIHRGNGDSPRKQGGPVLAKEKIPKDGEDTFKRRLPERGIGEGPVKGAYQ
jgi:hypothetical protein